MDPLVKSRSDSFLLSLLSFSLSASVFMLYLKLSFKRICLICHTDVNVFVSVSISLNTVSAASRSLVSLQ